MLNSNKNLIEVTEENKTIQINDEFEELNDNNKENNCIINSNIDVKRNLEKIEINEIIQNSNNTLKHSQIEIKVEDEGIHIDNSKFISKVNKNSFTDKIAEKQKINEMFEKLNKNKFKNITNNNQENEELKIAQIKRNSYEKDDIEQNNPLNNVQIKDIKINNSPPGSDRDNKKEKIKNVKNKNLPNKYDMNINKNDNKFNNKFSNLLPNKTFKRFLNNKIKYYMNEEEIPKKFINNLNKHESKNNNINIDNNKNNKISLSKPSKSHISKILLTNSDKTSSSNLDFSNFYNLGNTESLSLSISNMPPNKMKYKNKSNGRTNKNFYHNQNINFSEEFNNHFLSNYNKIYIENKINKEKIEDLKNALKRQKSAMKDKNNKINILKYMNNNLKMEMNKLQMDYEFERLNNIETRKKYNEIKSNYIEIKNQYDLLNLKYITLNDENYNYRRNKTLYEKQIRTKNKMIENLLENNSNYKKKDLNNKLKEINYSTKSNYEIIYDFLKNSSDVGNGEIQKQEENGQKNGNNIKTIDYNKYDKLSYNELWNKRDWLTKEREDINNMLSKIPLRSKSKENIIKKNMLEKRIKDINCELMLVKLSIKKNLQKNN